MQGILSWQNNILPFFLNNKIEEWKTSLNKYSYLPSYLSLLVHTPIYYRVWTYGNLQLQNYWYEFTGTNSLVRIHWYEFTGTNSLVRIHWYEFTGTNSLVRIHWYEFTGTNFWPCSFSFFPAVGKASLIMIGC